MLRFDDHAGFHGAAISCVAGGALAAALAPLPFAAVGAAFAAALAFPTVPERRRVVGVAGCTVAALAWTLVPALWPLLLRADDDDAIELRLAALRTALDPELSALAGRAVDARREAGIGLPAQTRSELRALLDALACAALEVAARAAELTSAAAPALERELNARAGEILERARAAG